AQEKTRARRALPRTRVQGRGRSRPFRTARDLSPRAPPRLSWTALLPGGLPSWLNGTSPGNWAPPSPPERLDQPAALVRDDADCPAQVGPQDAGAGRLVARQRGRAREAVLVVQAA